MARTDHDTWGPATSVGTTATLVATARALASRAGLINDPFAEPLVRAVGVDFFSEIASGERAISDLGDDNGFALLTDLFAVRTRFFDDFLTDAGRAGIRQAVILASGLDARPFRLWWPAGACVYEIDQPQVIEFKTQTLRGLAATPTADRRAVGIDLRREWPHALHRVGFDATKPTAWIAEGLFIGFLSPGTQDRLLNNVTALSAAGSRMAADYLPSRSRPFVSQEHALAQRWRPYGFDRDMTELTYADEQHDTAESMAALGWRTVVSELSDLFTATGLPGLRRQDLGEAPVAGRYVSATLV
ncbi:MAG: class I SAM-dependent methyltransferase [Mycobacterium sp.]|uniref:SAM-dependent methyltransferase n=1 Tax=Mycobacterium sp. TaxID=1785 RepID=UPI003C50CBE6